MSPRLPLRTSLHDQLVALLREGLSAALWPNELPSEAELCREFQVSRMTLRRALAQLARERWFTLGGQGRKHTIRRKRSAPLRLLGRIIRVLTPFSTFDLGGVARAAIGTLSEHLSKADYRLEVDTIRTLQAARASEPPAARCAPEHRRVGSLLCDETDAALVRRKRSRLRGGLRVHEGVPLSCVYHDSEAAARHAAGRLCARGHRELVHLIEKFTSLGDRLGSVAFVEEAQRLGSHPRIVEHGTEMLDVNLTLGQLLAGRPRPTGFVIGNPGDCLTALYHFLGAGLRVPTDVALVSLWDDPSLESALPTMARYRVDGTKMGRKLATTLLDMLKHGGGKLRAVRILPEFVNGGTLDDAEAAKCKLVG